MYRILIIISKFLFLIVPVLLSIAFFTLLERKILASIQLRLGCSVVGVYGLLQPFADALKLLSKELIVPRNSNVILFIITPYFSLALGLIPWFVIPVYWTSIYSDINLSIIFLFSVSSLSVYSILISGWASNSKYSFFGSLRACAQMISYEVCIGLILISVVICSNSFNLIKIVENQYSMWFIFPLLPAAILFFICSLAETSRIPFDFPEAESELVSGYNTEYSSVGFVFFFLSEYSRIIVMSSLFVLIFLGGWDIPFLKIQDKVTSIFIFSFKTFVLIFIFILIRGTLPRYRYDNLMGLLWKSFLPLSLGYFITAVSIQFSFNLLPWIL